MLDLMTLGLSIGAQEELQKARQDTGAVCHQQEEAAPSDAESTSTMMEACAEALESVLNTVENAASSVVSAMTPSSEMVESVMDNCTIEAPTVDLSLPTKAVLKK
ncbi:unnamed protein product [Amoebophrya sp. A120]|nr:unnamed protein product [Amoebophrya sp. A120]|eukprot:GSA120T00011024001.1